MFETFDKKARRVVFCARYEAAQLGSPAIESEHLLLGLLREGRSRLRAIPQLRHPARIFLEIAAATTKRTSIPIRVRLPFSEECRRILAYGAQEAELMGSKAIRVEHLVLGILREENSLAARLLRGVEIEQMRVLAAATGREGPVSRSLKAPLRALSAIFGQRPVKAEVVEAERKDG